MKFLKDIKCLIRGEIPTSILVKRGLKVGDNFNRLSRTFIDPSHCHLIEIGNNVTISTNVTLLAHDASTKKLLDYTKIGKIIIKDNVFIGSGTIILPNVVIGKNSIIGAGSVVTKNVEDNSVVCGNPAKKMTKVKEYKNKNLQALKEKKCFDESYIYSKKIEQKKINEMKKSVKKSISFIK